MPNVLAPCPLCKSSVVWVRSLSHVLILYGSAFREAFRTNTLSRTSCSPLVSCLLIAIWYFRFIPISANITSDSDEKPRPDKALTRAVSIQAPYTFAWFPAIWQRFITWESPPSLPAKLALQSLTTTEARKPTGTHPNYQRQRFASVEQGFHLFILIWFDCRPER